MLLNTLACSPAISEMFELSEKRPEMHSVIETQIQVKRNLLARPKLQISVRLYDL